MNANKLIIAVMVLTLAGTVACGEDSCPSCLDEAPPIAILKVDVVEFYIHAILMSPSPDQIHCQLTLKIENLSSKYSYSSVSIPSAKVYLSSTNQLLGEISFETDWDGTLNAGVVHTIVINKIVEESPVFANPCDEDLYLELRITVPNYGEMQRRTPTDLFSCLI